MSTLIKHIVGQLDLLEGHSLFGELLSSEMRVRMEIESGRKRRIGFSSYEPRRTMVGISVALVVNWNYVHQHGVFRFWVQPCEAYA